MPNKLEDPKIEQYAQEDYVRKLGFDTDDEGWLETELAVTSREKNWFAFERIHHVAFHKLVYTGSWPDIVRLFNDQYGDDLTVEQAKHLSLRRWRYIVGATVALKSGQTDKSVWKRAARDFEDHHRRAEERIEMWCAARKDRFPSVKTKKAIPFSVGAYFNECIEKIPQLFTNPQCTAIRPGVILRVIAYDPQEGYFKLDFPPDIREQIRPGKEVRPWESSDADYFFHVDLKQRDEMFEFIDPLS